MSAETPVAHALSDDELFLAITQGAAPLGDMAAFRNVSLQQLLERVLAPEMSDRLHRAADFYNARLRLKAAEARSAAIFALRRILDSPDDLPPLALLRAAIALLHHTKPETRDGPPPSHSPTPPPTPPPAPPPPPPASSSPPRPPTQPSPTPTPPPSPASRATATPLAAPASVPPSLHANPPPRPDSPSPPASPRTQNDSSTSPASSFGSDAPARREPPPRAATRDHSPPIPPRPSPSALAPLPPLSRGPTSLPGPFRLPRSLSPTLPHAPIPSLPRAPPRPSR